MLLFLFYKKKKQFKAKDKNELKNFKIFYILFFFSKLHKIVFAAKKLKGMRFTLLVSKTFLT